MRLLIQKILSNHPNIIDIVDKSFLKIYYNKRYRYIYKFTYIINDIEVPIVIGVPYDWDRKLIDVYIEDYREFDYIPHLDEYGKLCLFDLEGVLIDKHFDGLLNQTLQRLHNTLWNGLNSLNKEDFIEEFEQYWERLPNTKILKSMVSATEDIKLIKYADNYRDIIKKKNDKFIDILKKQNNYKLFASDTEEDFKFYRDMNTIKNAVYVYINADEYIYPPDWRRRLSIGYICNLVNHKSVDKEKLLVNISKCKSDLVLIFNIQQPNDCINIIGVIVKNFTITLSKTKITLTSQEEPIPCHIVRCDREFLLNRGGATSYLNSIKVLVIGCGSIGGYLINELIKTGIDNICVVDSDIMKEENIYRHLLGIEYVGEYKSNAIVDYVKKNIPNVNINSYEDNIEDIINDESITLTEYDLIISAVGNHNLNRWINEYMHINGINVPVVYLWNEVLGIGNHVAFILTSYKGCYECFFSESEEGIYDRTSYCEKGQSFAKKIRGCGSAYLPYSSTNSLTTVVTAIEIIRYYFEDRIKENILVSSKGDKLYFQNSGLKTSNRYNKQLETKICLEGEKFRNDKCLICGDK